MCNHYHLALETPAGNLVAGMRWLQGTFATRFNRLCEERGHLFQGRCKSLIVDPCEGLGPLCHYIHFNPVREGLCRVWELAAWRWSSMHWLTTRLHRGSLHETSRRISAWARTPDAKLARKLGRATNHKT